MLKKITFGVKTNKWHHYLYTCDVSHTIHQYSVLQRYLCGITLIIHISFQRPVRFFRVFPLISIDCNKHIAVTFHLQLIVCISYKKKFNKYNLYTASNTLCKIILFPIVFPLHTDIRIMIIISILKRIYWMFLLLHLF